MSLVLTKRSKNILIDRITKSCFTHYLTATKQTVDQDNKPQLPYHRFNVVANTFIKKVKSQFSRFHTLHIGLHYSIETSQDSP